MIPDPPAIGLFVVAALALLLVPGPAVLYIVARSIHQGRRAGLVSVLGIHVGTLAHIAAATLGLSALVLSSAVAFTAVKIAGARLSDRARAVDAVLAAGPSRTSRSAASETCGARSRRGSSSTSSIRRRRCSSSRSCRSSSTRTRRILRCRSPFSACSSRVLGLITDSMWALAAGTAGGMLRRSRRFVRTQRYVTGTVYVGLGVATAFAGSVED